MITAEKLAIRGSIRADLPPLTSLRTFWYVAEHNSFKAAAEALFVTQAAVSHQIRQLEEHLGVSLFERGNREVRLTRDGQRLMPYVQQGFSALRAGVTLVKDDSDPYALNLSVVPSFAGRWLVRHLGSFQEGYPGIRLHVTPDASLESFSDGEMDLAIRYGGGKYPGLRSELLLRDSFIVVATPAVMTQFPCEDQALHTLPLLEDTTVHQPGWAAWCEYGGLTLTRGAEGLALADESLVLDAALAGQGYALVRRSLAQDLIDSGALELAFKHELPSDSGYYLVAPEAHFVRAKVKHFMGWIREEVRQSFGPEVGAYHGT